MPDIVRQNCGIDCCRDPRDEGVWNVKRNALLAERVTEGSGSNSGLVRDVPVVELTQQAMPSPHLTARNAGGELGDIDGTDAELGTRSSQRCKSATSSSGPS